MDGKPVSGKTSFDTNLALLKAYENVVKILIWVTVQKSVDRETPALVRIAIEDKDWTNDWTIAISESQ